MSDDHYTYFWVSILFFLVIFAGIVWSMMQPVVRYEVVYEDPV